MDLIADARYVAQSAFNRPESSQDLSCVRFRLLSFENDFLGALMFDTTYRKLAGLYCVKNQLLKLNGQSAERIVDDLGGCRDR